MATKHQQRVLEDIERKWQYPLGVEVTSSPAFSGRDVFLVGSDGKLYAIRDEETEGVPLPMPANGYRLLGSPVADMHGTIYVVGRLQDNHLPYHGVLVAFRRDGYIRWTYDLGTFNSEAEIVAPAVAFLSDFAEENLLYVCAGAKGGYRRRLVAVLDMPLMGYRELWDFPLVPTPEHLPAQYVIKRAPAVCHDGSICLLSDDAEEPFVNAKLNQVVVANGEPRWGLQGEVEIPGEFWVSSSEMAIGFDMQEEVDVIYFGMSPRLRAVKQFDAERGWGYENASGHFDAAPVVAHYASDEDDVAAIFAPCQDYFVYAIRPNGQRHWDLTSDELPGPVNSSPVLAADGYLYVGDATGRFHALPYLNPDLQPRSYPTTGPIESSPVIAPDGTVYVVSRDGNLYAFRTEATGIAPAPWPMFRRDPRHTGSAIEWPATLEGYGRHVMIAGVHQWNLDGRVYTAIRRGRTLYFKTEDGNKQRELDRGIHRDRLPWIYVHEMPSRIVPTVVGKERELLSAEITLDEGTNPDAPVSTGYHVYQPEEVYGAAFEVTGHAAFPLDNNYWLVLNKWRRDGIEFDLHRRSGVGPGWNWSFVESFWLGEDRIEWTNESANTRLSLENDDFDLYERRALLRFSRLNEPGSILVRIITWLVNWFSRIFSGLRRLFFSGWKRRSGR